MVLSWLEMNPLTLTVSGEKTLTMCRSLCMLSQDWSLSTVQPRMAHSILRLPSGASAIRRNSPNLSLLTFTFGPFELSWTIYVSDSLILWSSMNMNHVFHSPVNVRWGDRMDREANKTNNPGCLFVCLDPHCSRKNQTLEIFPFDQHLFHQPIQSQSRSCWWHGEHDMSLPRDSRVEYRPVFCTSNGAIRLAPVIPPRQDGSGKIKTNSSSFIWIKSRTDQDQYLHTIHARSFVEIIYSILYIYIVCIWFYLCI